MEPPRVPSRSPTGLKPGGTLTGTTAFLEPWTFDGLIHLTPGGLVDLLLRAGFEIEYIWPGWDVNLAVNIPAMRPFGLLGKFIGHTQRLIHLGLWRLMNASRILTGRTARKRIIQDLEFTGSINFHARKKS